MVTPTLEQRMIFAHKEGIALAKCCLSEDEVRMIAANRFADRNEYDAMVAGFLGQLKRMGNKQ